MATKTVFLREAVAADFQPLLALYRDLDVTHQLLDVGVRSRDDRARLVHLKRSLVDPRTRLVVARNRSEVVGFAIAGFVSQDRDVVIQAISVRRDFRRRGVGSSLVRDVEAWAQDKKSRYVELAVYDFNPEARAFYERLGYLTVSRVMRRDPSFEMISDLVKR
jgi:ribosomal protein S18 acetylase RimI-like enzyme